ncbi:MAG: hypothetical protein GY804_11770 [Alphaproteobacteria bacterium]|nr:hypothetical protein [Alphaproteobacteria bacterium]
MARSRNIKPALFSNDELADNDPLGRLLFIGMWTIADCNGNLMWREKRIKAQILPYDNCDIKKLAINLDDSGFIRFYSDGDNLMVNIVNFSKHQNPHKNEREKGSDVPKFVDTNRESIDMTTLTINRDKSGLKRNDSTSDRADSLNLIPDSPILIPDMPESKSDFKEVLEYLKLVTGRGFRESTDLKARLKTYSADEIKAVIDYKAKEWMGSDMQKYLRPQTLFNKTKFEGYLNDSNQLVPATNKKQSNFENTMSNLVGMDLSGKELLT